MLSNAASCQPNHILKMIGRYYHPTKIKYITLFSICQVLLTIKIVDPAVGVEVGAYVAIGGDHDKFVGAFYIINIIAVLLFDLVENIRIIRNPRGGFFVFRGGGEAHVDTVLLVVLIQKIFVSEFER